MHRQLTTNVFFLFFFAVGIFGKTIAQPIKNGNAASGFVLAMMDTLYSKQLQEARTVNIYLPEGYNKDSADTYPVIYLLDGGVQEDFVHVTGLVQYNTQPWIARFPKTIVVGIESTNRKRDFTFPVRKLDFMERMGMKPAQMPSYGGATAFIAFLATELQPYIDGKYKTNGARTIIGESLGGLLATEILLKKRTLFDTYIIIAPSLWWGRESLLTEAPMLLKAAPTKDINVYVGACNKAESAIMYEDALQLANLLKQYGGARIKTTFDYLPDETHATVSHQAIYNAFKRVYKR